MKKLFEQYRDGKGTLVISFNDSKTATGNFIKEDDGFLQISGQSNAIGQICYVPYPNENLYVLERFRGSDEEFRVVCLQFLGCKSACRRDRSRIGFHG